MSVQIPHFSLPFRIVNGAAAVSEQDTLPEITDCVQAIVRYPLGYREDIPDFGIADQTFTRGGADAAVVSAAVRRWEPRAIEATTSDSSDLAELIARVTVEVSGRQGAPT